MCKLSKVTRLQLINKCTKVASDEPHISIGIFCNGTNPVELFVVGGQFNLLPFRLEIFFI